MSGEWPAGPGDRPSRSGDRPSGSGEWPAGSGEWPAGSGEWPAGSGEWPAGSGEWPAGSRDRGRYRPRPEELWADEDAGPVVRPFAVTRGRTRARRRGRALDLIAVVVTAEVPMPDPVTLGPEDERILEFCVNPSSVAELSSALRLPVGVVRVLVSDLLDRGLLNVQSAAAPAGRPDVRILKEVIDGLRAL